MEKSGGFLFRTAMLLANRILLAQNKYREKATLKTMSLVGIDCLCTNKPARDSWIKTEKTGAWRAAVTAGKLPLFCSLPLFDIVVVVVLVVFVIVFVAVVLVWCSGVAKVDSSFLVLECFVLSVLWML